MINQITWVMKAEDFATEAHKGQKRKVGGLDYITHPEAVAKSMDSTFLKMVAWLHDVVEDTDRTLNDIAEFFKDYYRVKELVHVVDLLTHDKEKPYLDYVLKVRTNKDAIRVKLADIAHNTETSPESWKCIRTKWQLAKYILEH